MPQLHYNYNYMKNCNWLHQLQLQITIDPTLHGTHVEYISKPIQNLQTHQPTVKVRGPHIGLLAGSLMCSF